MYIKKIDIENVRGFSKLSFNFQRPDKTYPGWTVFVGGNSSGKSTILKSIALALMGPDTGRILAGTTLGWIRAGQHKASAVLTLDFDKQVDHFRKGRPPVGDFTAGVRWAVDPKSGDIPEFRPVEKRNPSGSRILTAERGPWQNNSEGWFSAGYGPMRRLSGSSTESMRYAATRGAESRFVTLFREDAALSESEEWLRRVHSRWLESKSPEEKDMLDGVRALLGDGLLPHGMHISEVKVDHVLVKDDRGVVLPMRDISDGCRSVYSTILDLVHGMFEVYGGKGLFVKGDNGAPVVSKPGVVIIDEIESHLHPSWQRDIPFWLKQHFPNVQFLVSTHSPFVAQAADPGGLFILPVQDDLGAAPRAATEVEYEKVRMGSAHKTVLGVAFGLSSTRSRWAEQKIRQWQELNAKSKAEVKLTSRERKEYSVVSKQIKLAFDDEPSIAEAM